jgi:hypothetical protein
MIGPDGVNIPGRRYHKLDADVPVMIAVSVPGVPDRHVFWRDMEKAGIILLYDEEIVTVPKMSA